MITDSNVLTTKKAIKKLQTDFKTLVQSTKRILIDKHKRGELKYDDFREDFIFDLSESIRDQSQNYFEKKSEAIYNSSDYDQLFIVLNACWDYLNPFLLQHIISNCDEEQLQSGMDEYLTNLEGFLNDTNIDVFLKALPPSDRKLPHAPPPLDLQEVVTKHELSIAVSLKYIEDIRIELCHTMQLTHFSLYIASFGIGSLIIMWYVTAKVAEMLADLERDGRNNFKIISIEGS